MAAELRHLETFACEALRAGRDRGEIAKVLAEAGWPEAQVAAALKVFSDRPFPVPVPVPRPALLAREVFEYLVLYGTLYFAAWNLGALLFALVNYALPDEPVRHWPAFYEDDARRWCAGAVCAGFPAFFWLASRLAQRLARDSVRRLSPARRWLTYALAFTCAVALLVDAATLAYTALGGELSLRVFLKVLVVAAIAGSALACYLPEQYREEDGMSRFRVGGKRLSVLAGVVAAAAVAASFWLDPPWEYRDRAFDRARLTALNDLIPRVQRYAAEHGALPDDLGQLDDSSPGFLNFSPDWHDPETRQPYAYTKTGAQTYKLCINFALDAAAEPLSGYGYDRHVPGLNCYDEAVKTGQ